MGSVVGERRWVEAMLNWEAGGELAVDPMADEQVMAVEGEG